MPRRLILMRHAKSDWANADVSDHDRPLNARGRLAATLMGEWLREAGHTPGAALVSSAHRTQETWARLGIDAPMQTLRPLYHATVDVMLEAARAAPEEAETLLILGHMPVIKDTANLMLGLHAIGAYPTAKAVVIEFAEESWFEIAFGDGRLVDEAAPKDLV